MSDAADGPADDLYEFRKRPITVKARRLDERVEIETMEGTLVGEPGDWLIEDVEGERYPCDDDVFRQTYKPRSVPAGREYEREVTDDRTEGE